MINVRRSILYWYWGKKRVHVSKKRHKQKKKEKADQDIKKENSKSCPEHFIVKVSRMNLLANLPAPPVLCLLYNYTPYKQKTKNKSVYDRIAKSCVLFLYEFNFRSQFYSPFISFQWSQSLSCVCMVWSWTLAKEYKGNFTRTIIQQGQTQFRFETKAKTGHLEAVRKLFQILNRAGGLCTSP